ncbi:LysR family transcriptional regulator [Neogemmobacter tilapiae]|uniref:Transcriptional regulator n=1 Tax=Neogemmobacter tilapiae TaxID=875041 RepID=A0A918TG22_9RHOB|nr:LysR family transcriptional regulator [Gemmobacter tilapiae]GHC46740.1 transcriptional regulator [Gemmobacter tilapiae]
MQGNISLDDLSLFLAVASSGGLSGAVASTGTSAPTLSRRMAELERATGQHLFERGRNGYALTARGRELLAEASALRPLQQRIAQWASGPGTTPRVRITAGSWTARLIARNIGRYWQPGAPWVPEFISANANLDLARREADIGIRARRPEQPWLAAQKAQDVRYAVYGLASAPKGFIALDAQALTPAERWIREHHAAQIITTVNTERVALDLARAGMGRIVLPTFAGDDGTGLQRLSDDIPEIAHEAWLVSHHEARHDPPIRRALAALIRLLRGAT